MSVRKLVSRCGLLKSAKGAAGAVVMLGPAITAADAALFPNVDTDQLQEPAIECPAAPFRREYCSKCRLLAPPDACRSIAGFISARGWCDLKVAKAQKERDSKNRCEDDSDSISYDFVPARLRERRRGCQPATPSRAGTATGSIAIHPAGASFVKVI